MPEAGELAPDFTLASDTEGDVTLSALRGRKVVLYFYPRDDTPGCTTQACGIRDSWAALEGTGAKLLGISPDDVAAHGRFRAKFDLPHTLLADEGAEVAKAYGVWVEKNMYGKKSMGVERSTFLIDADGRIAQVWRRVKPADHVDLLLEALA